MTILMLETIADEAMALLETAAPVILSPTPQAQEHDLPFSEVTAIVTRGLGQLDRSLIEICPNLKVIARCGAGLNNLDLVAANDNAIPVVFAPGINANAVAEHSLMLMMMALRKGFHCAAEVKQNNWDCRNAFQGDDLAGKKVSIVGGGSIGGKTAALCQAFSMQVAICSRSGKGIEGLKLSMDQNLASSDLVSLHIPLTDETYHLFSEDIIAKMKPGVLLVNTARGELVDANAVSAALDSGQLGGYAADVIEGEKLSSKIIEHPQSIVTPHVAAMTKRTYQKMSLYTATNVIEVLLGGNPDPKSIYSNS